jgi:hypothetical protein
MVRRFYFWNNSLSLPRDIGIDQLFYTQSGFRYFDFLQPQGSRLRVILLKKSSCGAWLRFLVGQKRSPSRLVARVFLTCVIYENVDIVFIGICNKHVSYPLSILNVIFLKSNSFRFKETLISFNNK